MKRFFFALIVAIGLAGCSEEPPVSAQVLASAIDYTFIGGRGETDADGNVLMWTADVSGDLNGTMFWWFPPNQEEPDPYVGGELSFYSGIWELRDGDRMLLRGRSTGKTDVKTETDGVWDGHGIVVEAAQEYASLIGARIYETGSVEFGENPPETLTGKGMFSVISD